MHVGEHVLCGVLIETAEIFLRAINANGALMRCVKAASACYFLKMVIIDGYPESTRRFRQTET